MLFQSMLSDNNSQQIPVVIPEISAFTEPLALGTDTAELSAWWWMPYLASDFPEITGVTKRYFFIYSTDHDLGGSYWGEGDELDLSDFVEKGKCFGTNGSQETPRLYRINGKIHFYFHPVQIPQQTDLYTTSGGSLTNIDLSGNWTFYDNVLGLYTAANGNQIGGYDENHTGYMNVRKMSESSYRAKHLVTSNSSPSNPATSRYSISVDGFNWTREQPDVVKTYDGGGEVMSTGMRMESVYNNGSKNLAFTQSSSTTITARYFVVNEVDNDWKNPIFIKRLSEIGDFGYSTIYYDIPGKTLHIYAPKNSSTELYHATLDMTDFSNWDI